MSGAMAGRGRPGPAGPQGPMGPEGPKGDPAFTLAIGDVSAVPYGSAPEATNVGTNQDQVWDLKLVTGATGVLTGAGVPTGTDGTSLGQLYFCTSNQTYYGLVELSENNNKWRPLMTQESAIRRYEMDLVVMDNNSEFKQMMMASIMFDDVERQMTLALAGQINLPAGAVSWDWGVSTHELEKLRADCAQRGITSIPVNFTKTVNGVTTTVTQNLLGGHPEYGTRHLQHIIPPIAGTGSNPGVRTIWKNGKLFTVVNETSPGGATQYGNAPAGNTGEYNQYDDLTMISFRIAEDSDYVTYFGASATVVIPYA